jgi:hypothetical protein
VTAAPGSAPTALLTTMISAEPSLSTSATTGYSISVPDDRGTESSCSPVAPSNTYAVCSSA